MTRLLFATARGARLQGQFYNWTTGKNEWRQCPAERADRIHPDDVHLQYGPISTALREEALGDFVVASVYGIELGNFWLRQSDHRAFQEMSQFDRSVSLLLLAEALADEGL